MLSHADMQESAWAAHRAVQVEWLRNLAEQPGSMSRRCAAVGADRPSVIRMARHLGVNIGPDVQRWALLRDSFMQGKISSLPLRPADPAPILTTYKPVPKRSRRMLVRPLPRGTRRAVEGLLNPKQADDFKALMDNKGFRIREALSAVGRSDVLIQLGFTGA